MSMSKARVSRVKSMLSSRNPSDRDNSHMMSAANRSSGKKWMQGAVKRPGALTAKAKSVGESPMSFAREHYHDSGLTGQQARFAVIAQKSKHR